MKKLKSCLFITCVLFAACRKDTAQLVTNDAVTTIFKPAPVTVTYRDETINGIKYLVFIATGIAQTKGILVMGSGNDESNPAVGSLDGAEDGELCNKAAQNGYLAAIVQYRKTLGTQTTTYSHTSEKSWNDSSEQIAQDYDKCITALSGKYGVAKSKSVVGGVSFAGFMLLNDIAIDTTLGYCQGVLAPRSAAGDWQAQHFNIPVYSIACSGHNEDDYSGADLYAHITNAAIKAKSAGVTDTGCSTHTDSNWIDQMYAQMTAWLM
jgi:hypothetical protein